MPKPSVIAYVTIIPFILLALAGETQTQKNNATVNLGVSSGYGYPSFLRANTSNVPSLNLSADYSLNKLFSLGLYGSYTYSLYRSHSMPPPELHYKDVWKGWDVGIRSSFHLSPLIITNKKIDLYLAAFFGYTVHYLLYDKKHIARYNYKFKVDDINAGSIVGLRYYLSRVIGFYAETGLARKLFVSGGLAFNINFKQAGQRIPFLDTSPMISN